MRKDKMLKMTKVLRVIAQAISMRHRKRGKCPCDTAPLAALYFLTVM